VDTGHRVSVRRAAGLLGLGVLVAGAFFAGATMDNWAGGKRVNSRETPPARYDPSKGFPRPGSSCPPGPEWPEKAAAARQAVIRQAADAIQAECRAAAGGDWERWERQTDPYRQALKPRADSARTIPEVGDYPGYDVMEGRDGFPLFEVGARTAVRPLVDPASLNPLREGRAVVAADRWLRRRGIDLIFVPVPKMTEVYIEHFVDAPADGVVSPRIRRTLLEMLQAGVEVVDAFPRFRELREPCPDYLYNTADSHWAPRGMRVVAKEVADRIGRYAFGARARYALPIVRSAPGPYNFLDVVGGLGYSLLTPQQRERAERVQTTNQVEVCMPDGLPPPADSASPVLLIGNSYVLQFREQLVKELNLLVRSRWGLSQTTDAFADFVREPRSLEHVRVLVWVTTTQHLASFKPLPPPVLEALAE
jgi:hypothetical protein